MFFWFVALRYLKPTLVILCGLEFFFICVDSLQYFDALAQSANNAIWFLAFDAMYAFNYVLPLALLLGLIVFYISLIKSNQYVALLSLGYSRRRIFYPPFLIINLVVCGYIGLNATDFVYAQERADNIVSSSNNADVSKDLFIRYNTDYVFFEKVYPLLQKAENIQIYHTEYKDSRKLVSITRAKEGYFHNDEWELLNPQVSILPTSYDLGDKGMITTGHDSTTTLKGFKPKVLDTFYKNKPAISITDAFYSLQILMQEGADTTRTRGVLYTLAVTPFFISMLCVIIAYYAPPLARYGNLAMLGVSLSVLSLMVWGVFFSLGKLNANAVFIPEFSMLVPLGILLVVSIVYYRKLDEI